MRLIELHTKKTPRLKALYLLLGLITLILAAGLFWRQLLQQPHYEGKRQRQSLRRILQPGTRGHIYDRYGKLLVGNRPLFSVVVYLGELREEFRDEYYKLVRIAREQDEKINRIALKRAARFNVIQRYLAQINKITGRDACLSAQTLDRHYAQRILLPLPLIKDLSPEEYAQLTEQLAVDSPVQIFADSARYYPYGSAAAHTLGYVSATLDIPDEGLPGEGLTTFSIPGKKGKAGLEKAFDQHLQGSSGGEVWQVDPVGYQYAQVSETKPTQGQHLTTSLDVDLQCIAEQALGSKVGAVVVLEVKTGEILVLASKPDYDLNDLSPSMPAAVYTDINDRGAWLNRATQGLYPPGSPFKLITSLAGFRTGVLTPDSLSHCSGYYPVGRRQYPCDCRHGHGKVDVVRALKTSCNILFYEYALQMGAQAISDEARRFFLDQPTGIELPFAATGMIVPDPAWKKKAREGARWLGGDTANLAIGQGYLLTTPLHMACFTAALARGETRTQPTLIHDPKRQITSVDHAGSRITGINAEHYQTLIEGMRQSAASGTSRFLSVSGINIAAKSGTAQVRPQGVPLTLAWIIAFAPIENPEIAICVMVEGQDPNDNYGGGKTAAPIARPILHHYFKNGGKAATPSGAIRLASALKR